MGGEYKRVEACPNYLIVQKGVSVRRREGLFKGQEICQMQEVITPVQVSENPHQPMGAKKKPLGPRRLSRGKRKKHILVS